MTPKPLTFEPHPLLLPLAVEVGYAGPMGTLAPPFDLAGARPTDAALPRPEELGLDDDAAQLLTADVRALLRHGGYRPSGRGKPSSEYLQRAAAEGRLPVINHAVDLCNGVSLASRLPISVVDLDRTEGPLRVAVCDGGSYVFNASGQEIRLDGLLCLFDAAGPIANAVKDSQRTKTSSATRRTLTVLWAPAHHAALARAAARWYRDLAATSGATGYLGAAEIPVAGAPEELSWERDASAPQG